MKTSIPRTLLTAIPALAAAGCTENPAPRPNVIFILMDDAGYGDFGCYWQQKIETPNIDALSECGVRFTDMYSAAPLSSPARCGLLTGRHAGHAQIRANDEMEWRGDVWNHGTVCWDGWQMKDANMYQFHFSVSGRHEISHPPSSPSSTYAW